MAAAAAEPMLQNLTTTTIRAPYSTSAAPSMADSLPALNFGFDDLRARMSSFSKRFDEFIEQGRRRVLEERNQFKMNVAEIQDDKVAKQRAITNIAQQSHQHAETLTSQSAETEEMKSAIASLTASRDEHLVSVANLKSKIASARQNIATRKAAQRQHQQYLSHQASFNKPELDFWETLLGLRIEGTGVEDKVRFVFVGIEAKKLDREAWFELDMSGGGAAITTTATTTTRPKGYEIVSCRPKLDDAKMDNCLKKMRDAEDFVGFLKGMRELFVEEMK